MNVYGIYLAALHQQDLLEQAQAVSPSQARDGVAAETPAWRRTLSGALASAARRLDPSVEVEHLLPWRPAEEPTCCRPAERASIS